MAERARKSASTARAKKPAAAKGRAGKSAAKKAGSRKPPTDKQRAALQKSYEDVKKAQKVLELRMRKHTQMVSSMFFAI